MIKQRVTAWFGRPCRLRQRVSIAREWQEAETALTAGSWFGSRTRGDSDRPRSRPPLSAKADFYAQHAKERLRTTQSAGERAGGFEPDRPVVLTGKNGRRLAGGPKQFPAPANRHCDRTPELLGSDRPAFPPLQPLAGESGMR